MTREVLNGISSLDKSGSYVGTVEHTSEGVKITGYVWVSQYSEKGIMNDYIEVNPNATFYYDIVYSNQEGNNFYIGFERFDADKTATSNDSTVYVIASTAAASNKRIVGTVDLSKNSQGTPVKWIRLRILNQWSGSSVTNGVAEIKMLSLLEGAADATRIQKNGVISSGHFRENNLEDSRIFKNEGIEANQFIEI